MTPSDNFNEDLDVIDAAADVVVDMFLDPNQETANSTTLPKYEIMVWIAAFGGKKPIGYNSSLTNLPTYSLGGTNLFASRSPPALHTSADRWIALYTPDPMAMAKPSILGWLPLISPISTKTSLHSYTIYGDRK
jgi:Glycosyl hydrolase family 12